MPAESTVQRETLFGHPVGLYTLFFAEMWERFSYYGMRALLIFYLTKGFMGYSDDEAYGVYGAYIALVYATGFFGGILSDRMLGTRRAIVLGGILMACGHLMMTVEHPTAFFLALALLITGNGLFKPNISSIVGSLYPTGSPRKEGGFTIFYMGINLGATISPLLCGYVGEKFAWHYGFGLATIGMMIGVAVFVAPIRVTQLLILGGSIATAVAMLFIQDNVYQLLVNVFAGLALVIAGAIAFIALGRGGVPDNVGGPPDPAALSRKIGPLRTDFVIYLAILLCVPLFALLVQRSTLSTWILGGFGLLALAYLLFEAFRRSKVERDRLFVIIILSGFSMLFWACFEQAGSSMANFTDRNVDRVFNDRTVSEAEVGSSVRFHVPPETNDPALRELPLLTQEQLGRTNDNPEMRVKIATALQLANDGKSATKRLSPEKLAEYTELVTKDSTLLLTGLSALRDAVKLPNAPPELATIDWRIAGDNVGMGIGGDEIPASMFQAANPIYILLFGLLFTMLWTYLDTRGLDPSIPVKFALALVQLGLGFTLLWYGAEHASTQHGMVAMYWLLLGIMLTTTGELCTSPIGLSMVSTLSPRELVSTAMGAWWVSMALANQLSAWIAKLTGIDSEGAGPQVIPRPLDTVHIYGHVFGLVAIAAFVAAVVCLALSPLLNKWMHADADER